MEAAFTEIPGLREIQNIIHTKNLRGVTIEGDFKKEFNKTKAYVKELRGIPEELPRCFIDLALQAYERWPYSIIKFASAFNEAFNEVAGNNQNAFINFVLMHDEHDTIINGMIRNRGIDIYDQRVRELGKFYEKEIYDDPSLDIHSVSSIELGDSPRSR